MAKAAGTGKRLADPNGFEKSVLVDILKEVTALRKSQIELNKKNDDLRKKWGELYNRTDRMKGFAATQNEYKQAQSILREIENDLRV